MMTFPITRIEVEGYGSHSGTKVELEVIAIDANYFYTREMNGLGIVYSHLVKKESKNQRIAWSRNDGRRQYPGRFECDYNFYRAMRYTQFDKFDQPITKRFPNKTV